MLRIGICDDNENARESLVFMIDRFLHKDENEKHITEFSSGEELLQWMETHMGELDLLFLDIEMKGINGMDAAARIRKKDSSTIIVFVTGFGDYVFNGYTVGALDYLVKPVKEKRLQEVITRAMGVLLQQAPDTFTLRNTEGIYRIPKSQILYFYSNKRKVILISTSKKYEFYAKLDEVSETVGKDFIRIHQRYLVRAAAVSEVEGNNVLINGVTLPISRNLRQEVLLAFVKAMF